MQWKVASKKVVKATIGSGAGRWIVGLTISSDQPVTTGAAAAAAAREMTMQANKLLRLLPPPLLSL